MGAVEQPRDDEVAGVLVDGTQDDAGHEQDGQRHRDRTGAAGEGDHVDDREDYRGHGDGGRGREAFAEAVLDDAAVEEILEYCSNFACSYPTITHTTPVDDDIYNQRSMTETANSSVKRSNGSAVRALEWYREFRGITLMCLVYNN